EVRTLQARVGVLQRYRLRPGFVVEGWHFKVRLENVSFLVALHFQRRLFEGGQAATVVEGQLKLTVGIGRGQIGYGGVFPRRLRTPAQLKLDLVAALAALLQGDATVGRVLNADAAGRPLQVARRRQVAQAHGIVGEFQLEFAAAAGDVQVGRRGLSR